MKFKRLSLVILAALSIPAMAAAGDKVFSTMTRPQNLTGVSVPTITVPISTAWTNSSKGKVKLDDRCKLQIIMTRLDQVALPDSDPLFNGDEVICVVHANASIGAVAETQSIVVRGESKSGKVLIKKVDLFAEGTYCTPKGLGQMNELYDITASCHEPSIVYSAAAACGGIYEPFASDPEQGICRGAFVSTPSSPVIATMGVAYKP